MSPIRQSRWQARDWKRREMGWNIVLGGDGEHRGSHLGVIWVAQRRRRELCSREESVYGFCWRLEAGRSSVVRVRWFESLGVLVCQSLVAASDGQLRGGLRLEGAVVTRVLADMSPICSPTLVRPISPTMRPTSLVVLATFLSRPGCAFESTSTSCPRPTSLASTVSHRQNSP